MAELINMGSVELEASLRSVSDAQVISPEELRKAKEYRESMDELGDSVAELKLAAGQDLIPALTTGANALATAINAFSSEDPLQFVIDQVRVYLQEVDDAREDTETFRQSIKDARNPLLNFAEATREATVALVNADTAWKVLTDSLDQEVALDEAKVKLVELEAAAKLAFGSGVQADIDAYEQQAAEFVAMLSAIAGGMSDISSKEILIRFKTQGPAAAIELAQWIARGAEYGGLSAVDALNLAGISTNPVKPQALGGPVMGGTSYLVGEQGPELFTPSSAGNITPNHALGGGATITVNVNGGDPDAVVRAIQKYARQNGAIPLQTTTSARF
jgi:hypothetical protein